MQSPPPHHPSRPECDSLTQGTILRIRWKVVGIVERPTGILRKCQSLVPPIKAVLGLSLRALPQTSMLLCYLELWTMPVLMDSQVAHQFLEGGYVSETATALKLRKSIQNWMPKRVWRYTFFWWTRDGRNLTREVWRYTSLWREKDGRNVWRYTSHWGSITYTNRNMYNIYYKATAKQKWHVKICKITYNDNEQYYSTLRMPLGARFDRVFDQLNYTAATKYLQESRVRIW